MQMKNLQTKIPMDTDTALQQAADRLGLPKSVAARYIIEATLVASGDLKGEARERARMALLIEDRRLLDPVRYPVS